MSAINQLLIEISLGSTKSMEKSLILLRRIISSLIVNNIIIASGLLAMILLGPGFHGPFGALAGIFVAFIFVSALSLLCFGLSRKRMKFNLREPTLLTPKVIIVLCFIGLGSMALFDLALTLLALLAFTFLPISILHGGFQMTLLASSLAFILSIFEIIRLKKTISEVAEV